MIGCGSRREKDSRLPTATDCRARRMTGEGHDFVNLVTLDINPDHKPNILFNLERIDGESHNRIPNRNVASDGQVCSTGYCLDNTYDEIHAYEILEHIGQQGDYRKFFDQFAEFWRILKPGGFLFATVPSFRSEWCWGDPSHKRVITPGTLVFLSQQQYQEQVGKTPMSDFRWYYSADFETVYSNDDDETHCFVLKAVK
jgi:hypothetical protein